MDLSNTTKLITATTPVFVEAEAQNFGAWFGILIAVIIGSIGSIFVILGLCIIWHTVYMKCFKKKDR
jgi:hypothetical protein